MTPNKGCGLPIWGTAYIVEVNRTRKVKSDAQVATNKKSNPVQNFYSSAALFAIQSAVIATAIQSVRLSHAGTLSRRMNIASCGLHDEIAKSL